MQRLISKLPLTNFSRSYSSASLKSYEYVPSFVFTSIAQANANAQETIRKQIWEHKRTSNRISHQQCPHCGQSLGAWCQCQYVKFQPKKSEMETFADKYQLSSENPILKEMTDIAKWDPKIKDKLWCVNLVKGICEYNLLEEFFTMTNEAFMRQYGQKLDSHPLVNKDGHSGGSFGWTAIQIKRAFYNWDEYKNTTI